MINIQQEFTKLKNVTYVIGENNQDYQTKFYRKRREDMNRKIVTYKPLRKSTVIYTDEKFFSVNGYKLSDNGSHNLMVILLNNTNTDEFYLSYTIDGTRFVTLEKLNGSCDIIHSEKDNISLKSNDHNILISYTYNDNGTIKPHTVLYDITNNKGNLVVKRLEENNNLDIKNGNILKVFGLNTEPNIIILKYDWTEKCYIDTEGNKYYYGGK